MMLRTVTLLVMFFLSTEALLCFSNECRPISTDTARRLAAYVHGALGFPSAVTLEMGETTLVGNSCFRRVHFHSQNPRFTVDVPLFLSPDQKFLSRDLFDTDLTPPGPPKQKSLSQSELISADLPRKGSSEATVTIVVFIDFQCPYCKRQMETINELLSSSKLPYIRVMLRHLPLPSHVWARSAAEIAACAYKQGNEAFWNLHDFLFENQQELSGQNIREKVLAEFSKQNAANVEQFRQCVDNRQTAAEIDRDIAFAREHGIRATPTVVINDQVNEGAVDFTELRALILRKQAGR